jgi:cystathionine gamma-synthase
MASFGAIVSLDLVGGAEAAEAVAAGTTLWLHATSLGGVESTLERRRRWPEESPDVPDGLLRLSVGIEDVEDLWDDLRRALDAVAP